MLVCALLAFSSINQNALFEQSNNVVFAEMLNTTNVDNLTTETSEEGYTLPSDWFSKIKSITGVIEVNRISH